MPFTTPAILAVYSMQSIWLSFPMASIVSTPLNTVTPVVETWYTVFLLSELSYSQLQRFPCCWLCHRLSVNCHPIDWLVPVPVHALQYVLAIAVGIRISGVLASAVAL